MHIAEGILSAPVLLAGAGLAAGGTALGLKGLDEERLPRAGILSASFFVASLIHVPVGPSSAHLLLNGLLGLLLGWAAFPAILVALVLQALFFQFGGLTVLGVNTVVMALPAVASGWVFGGLLRKGSVSAFLAGLLAGASAVLFSSLLMALALIMTEGDFLTIAATVVAANMPVVVLDGIISGFAVGFLKKVKPELLT